MLSTWVSRNLANTIVRRTLSTTSVFFCEPPKDTTSKYRNITKDRTEPVDVDTSIRYLQSEAYRTTYGEQPVWVPYRRNFIGGIPPRKTRRTCIRQGKISTGNPCPICRDEFLVLHEQNVDLLKQFICPHTQVILDYSRTGLCRTRHTELLVAIERARDQGLITFDVPFRHYDYNEYYDLKNAKSH